MRPTSWPKIQGVSTKGRKFVFLMIFFFCFLPLVGDFYFLKRTFVLDFPNPFFFIFATLSDHSDDQMIFQIWASSIPLWKKKATINKQLGVNPFFDWFWMTQKFWVRVIYTLNLILIDLKKTIKKVKTFGQATIF